MRIKIKPYVIFAFCCMLLYQNSVTAFATVTEDSEQTQKFGYSAEQAQAETKETTLPESQNQIIQSELPQESDIYSVSVKWDETDDKQPNFSCSPVWNPETHSYDQWEFVANNPLIVKNTSENSSVVEVEIYFQSNIQAEMQLALDTSEIGQERISVTLATGEEKNIYMSLSSTSSLLEISEEICVGMVSYRITNTETPEVIAETDTATTLEETAELIMPEPNIESAVKEELQTPNTNITDESTYDVESAPKVDIENDIDVKETDSISESTEQSYNGEIEPLPEENNNEKPNNET